MEKKNDSAEQVIEQPIVLETPEQKMSRLMLTITNRSRLQRFVRAVVGASGVPAVTKHDGQIKIVENYGVKPQVVLGEGSSYIEAAMSMVEKQKISYDDIMFAAGPEVRSLLSLDKRTEEANRSKTVMTFSI
jgi:hypothetical protein